MTDFYAGAEPITLLCPIKIGNVNSQSFEAITRDRLAKLDDLPISPLSKVPETFLCRFYILNDVFFEGLPAPEDHLKSKYLVFCCNYHGALDEYLRGFWRNAEDTARQLWQHCVAFDSVKDEATFISYIRRCLVKTTFFFNGSSGRPLQEQLKALYLKQEFTRFAVEHQHKKPNELRAAFKSFLTKCRPDDLTGPTWLPGMSTFPAETNTLTHGEQK